jgi:hypothetical protein
MRRNSFGKRPGRRGDLAAWYRALLERQAESGLSVADFAASAGVSAWTLYEWRRRLAGSGDDRDAAPRLVEVSVVPSPPPSMGTGIVVQLRSGHRLDVSAGFDDHDLRRLIGVLESC